MCLSSAILNGNFDMASSFCQENDVVWQMLNIFDHSQKMSKTISKIDETVKSQIQTAKYKSSNSRRAKPQQ